MSELAEIFKLLALHHDGDVCGSFHFACREVYPDESFTTGAGLPWIVLACNDILGSSGAIFNSGFEEFFRMSLPMERVISSYGKVGAQIFVERAFRVARSCVTIDPDRNVSVIEGQETNLSRAERSFYQTESFVQNALSAHIRKYLCELRDPPDRLFEVFVECIRKKPDQA
jgi:hypothetical protein